MQIDWSTWYGASHHLLLNLPDLCQLEPFQEDPQLLDPHLDKFVPSLADALLAYLRSPTSTLPESNTQLLTPVSHAICRLLYTFCKVRGEKVIVRFFSTETRHLELLLSAIEKGGQQDDGQSASPETAETWDWEERYIVLLWLSQLLLAPFDLASISSEETDDIVQPNIAGLSWPSNTPGLTIRVIPLALRYLSSSGKERNAAKILLVRIAMRKDMQELGILNALVQWALSSLHSSQVGHSTYYYIGTLSFLAGILVSSEGTTDMTPYLGQISKLIQNVYATEEPVFKAIKSSAIARKTIIKVLRTITVLLIQTPESMPDSDMAIEATIGHLLDSLADLATPVRLAASKALSVVTLKLPEEMAVEVGSAVLEALEKNILFVQKGGKGKARDLSRVNPLEWHGLMLTMAHLLYRHSIPTAQLPPILNALRLGLVFEQRSTSGTSIGTNVRDAACFGIWAMARRYTTNDLQKLQLKDDVFTQGGPLQQSPALQILATELVVSASLDPAGNIRRGSSAALQELIGRHPNTIAEGIRVVQVVDYHAVALRSRAVLEVALQAAKLSDEYYQGLLKALLGWRGIQDGDTGPRRVAADAIGKLVLTKQKSKNDTKTGSTWDIVSEAMDLVAERLKGLAAREIEERHGLILSLAAIIENFNYECSKARIAAEIEYGLEYNRHSGKRDIVYIVQTALSHLAWILKEVNSNWSTYRKPGLMAESCSRLLIDICPILRFDCILRQYESLAVVETQSEVDSTSSRRGPLEGSVTLLQFFGNPSFANKMENADLKVSNGGKPSPYKPMSLEFVHQANVSVSLGTFCIE
jgi:tubulin-specific chaperone D